jgi:hypothetical protein
MMAYVIARLINRGINLLFRHAFGPGGGFINSL